jgi:hypothetical protein
MVNSDEKLLALFGKKQVSMFEMAGLIGKEVKDKPFATMATPAPAAKAPAPAPIKSTPKKRAAVKDDAKIPLKSGTTLDPAKAWPFPTASKKP